MAPDVQEPKRSQNGQVNVRYKTPWKRTWVERFRALVTEHMPYCRIRYAF